MGSTIEFNDATPITTEQNRTKTLGHQVLLDNHAHAHAFGNEIIDELQRNRNRVLSEEFGYDRNVGTSIRNKAQIAPVDWIRTSMSLDFSKNAQNDIDIPTLMSIDTPTIHEVIEDVTEKQMKIALPPSDKLFQQSLETLDGNEADYSTPDSALNTCARICVRDIRRTNVSSIQRLL